MPGFVCIYCRKREPVVTPSEAHIIPHALGGTVAARETVCRECNHLVNRVVEEPALGSVLALQSMFGIRGRRNKVRRVQGMLKAGDIQATVYLNEHGELTDVVVVPSTGLDGRKHFSIMGPEPLVAAKMREIEAAHPDLRWQERPMPEKGTVEVGFVSDVTFNLLRRLAAKAAFERFAQLRSGEFVSSDDFNDVRSFVLNGEDRNTCAGILADPTLLGALLSPFKPPHHVIYVVAHPKTNVLGAFVIFYGLFFFWVRMSTKYRALGATDDLLLQDPQAREVQNPRLRGAVGDILIDWEQIVRPYVRDAAGTSKEAGRRAVTVFEASLDSFFGVRP